MIFWGTVLAFILGIMYYMLYPYDTKISTVYMPSSEAYVAGFVAQHQAAKDYAREAVIAINRITETLPHHDSTTTENSHSVLILSDAEQEKSPIDSFLPKGISSVQTNNFQPNVNSSAQSDDIIDFSSGFVSLLACFDQPERKLNDSNKYTEAKLTDCRAATTKYVMTYGPVPDELDRPYMRGKILLWEPSLLKRTKGNPDCGFLYYDSARSRYFINNSRHLTRTIPTAFINLFIGYLNGNDEGRVLVGTGENSRELLFCMTPVNDPYPRLGLRVLLDGTINQLPSNNAIEHSSTIPDGGWINLAKENSSTPLSITGSGANSRWNTYCSATSETCHADGFSFSKNHTITIPSGWFDSEHPEVVLGVPSTISFMALFKKGPYPVFESTSTAGNYGIKAEYKENKLTVTLSKNSTKHEVSATIQPEEMTQIDYILNAGGHKLYVNGELIKQESFGSSDLISSVGGTSFTLGGSLADYILYNFLIYNRSPEAGEALSQSIDLYGLARIYKSNMLRYIKKTGIQKITEDDEGEKE